MGTRADLYVGIGLGAEWIGSVAYDGDDVCDDFEKVSVEADYRKEVAALASSRDDFTDPSQGWPWPWPTSHTTDYAYTFHEGEIWVTRGGRWFTLKKLRNNEVDEEVFFDKTTQVELPDMSGRANVVMPGQARSGMIAVQLNAAKRPS
jgi:hypothetical protein